MLSALVHFGFILLLYCILAGEMSSGFLNILCHACTAGAPSSYVASAQAMMRS